MLQFAVGVLGRGTTIDKDIVRVVRSLGPEHEHSSAVTDITATRSVRIETRREWPDSPMSDVPDRYPLFELLGEVDMVAWPELGTAIDTGGRVAAHLRAAGQWILVADAIAGEVVIERLTSGGHLVRTLVGSVPGRGFLFNGPRAYIEAVGRARAQIEWLYAQAHAPQDRG